MPDQDFYQAPQATGSAWRDEVASRVQAHKARRRRRFDPDASLSLSFETETQSGSHTSAPSLSASPSVSTCVEEEEMPDIQNQRMAGPEENFQAALPQAEQPNIYERMAMRGAGVLKDSAAARDVFDSDNLIEFPRAVTVQNLFVEELAESLTMPRILDVPEPVSEPVTQAAPPLLATIRLDEDQDQPDWIKNYQEDTEELELPLQVAPLGPRVLSGVMDAMLVLTAAALFSVIVLSVAKFVPQGKAAIASAVLLPVVFWAAYHYLFLVFSRGGITPGMSMAQLELSSFEGCVPLRRTRASRAVAMMLSCASLGLGFAWAMVDEDSLGWHDRITRTYLRQS